MSTTVFPTPLILSVRRKLAHSGGSGTMKSYTDIYKETTMLWGGGEGKLKPIPKPKNKTTNKTRFIACYQAGW